MHVVKPLCTYQYYLAFWILEADCFGLVVDVTDNLTTAFFFVQSMATIIILRAFPTRATRLSSLGRKE